MSQRRERQGGVRAVGCLVWLVATVAFGGPDHATVARHVEGRRPQPRVRREDPLLAHLSVELRAEEALLRRHPRRLVLRRELAVHARARRDTSRCADPLLEGREDHRSDPAATAHRAGGGDRRQREGQRRPRLPPVGGRRAELGEATREHPAGRDRPAANRLGEALAGPEAVPGRRHAGRCLEAPLPELREGVCRVPGGPEARRRARPRHRVDRLRCVQGLRRPSRLPARPESPGWRTSPTSSRCPRWARGSSPCR